MMAKRPGAPPVRDEEARACRVPDGAVAREGPSRSAPGLPPRLGHIRGRAGRGPQHGVAGSWLYG